MNNSIKIIFSVIMLIKSLTVFSENYAILISAGKATTDDAFSNSEYWYDLFLAYEDLIIKEGYSHDNVYVFYGDGNDFTTTTYNRYKISYNGWTDPIVDFDNSYNTMYTQIGILSNIITENDNIHIRWVVGHGGAGNEDNYSALIQNLGIYISEQQIYDMFNQINNYKRRKIFWMTCHSGALLAGNNTFNNDKTTIITSCEWYFSCCGCAIPDYETIHAEFNYVITSSLYGEDQCGNPLNADYNNDHVISFDELYQEATTNPIIASCSGCPDDYTPQIGDNCPLASKIYLDESIILENAVLSGIREYLSDNIEAQNNLIIPNTANVIFAANKKIILKHGFHAQNGCYFHAYIGDISCVGKKMAANDNYTDTTEYYPKENIEKLKPKSNKLFECNPNPNDGNMLVSYEIPETETGIFEIYDFVGKKLLSYPLYGGKNTFTISATMLEEGIYFYRATAGNKRIAADKIVIIK